MTDVEKIISKTNYLTPSRYISGRIVEYDIRSANISILRETNTITQQEYDYLNHLPKINREIEIGLKEKADPSIYTTIQKGISEAKANLVDFNEIKEDQIVRVANDAVYINSDSDLHYLKFGNYVEFRPKSKYDIYLNLLGIIIFLEYMDDGNLNVDIKGIGDNMNLHQDYMIYSIISIITILERSGVIDAVQYLSELCEQYLKYELPVGYYREFNSASQYRIAYTSIDGLQYVSSSMGENDKYHLDINYNYTILRELWSILMEIYTMRVR